MVKAIISDVGNVLITCDMKKFDNIFDEVIDYTKVPRYNSYFSSVFDKEVYDLFERGKISGEQFYTYCAKEYCLQVGFDEFKKLFPQFLIIDDISRENANRLVQIKEEKGIEVVLLTNTNKLHFEEVLTRYDELKKFKQVTSYSAGYRKPEKEIYMKAVELTGCDISECLFIDDKKDFVDAFIRLGGQGIVHVPGTRIDLNEYLKDINL